MDVDDEEDSHSRRGAFEAAAVYAVLFVAERCGQVSCGVRRIQEGARRLMEGSEEIFRDAKFIHTLGIELVDFGLGWCETKMAKAAALEQQHRFVHAGALMTL